MYPSLQYVVIRLKIGANVVKTRGSGTVNNLIYIVTTYIHCTGFDNEGGSQAVKTG